MWAVVPLKRFVNAKQRLAEVLSPAERKGLVAAMVGDVLSALAQASGLAGVLLVSREPEAAAIAAHYSAQLFAEPPGADLSEAVQAAGGYLMANHGASATMILPADMPLVRGTDIDQVLSQHQRLTLVPDAIGDGTNCIISTPPNLIRYQFDGHSFKPHVEAAYAIDTAPQIVRNENFALDIDTPLDLDELLDRSGPCQTRTYLETSGIASRLRQPHNGSNAL